MCGTSMGVAMGHTAYVSVACVTFAAWRGRT
jgi:hypothetical protein